MLKAITHISLKSEGQDAYSVILSSESHSVACDSSGNLLAGELAKAVTTVHVFKGDTELVCGTDWIIDEIVAGTGATFDGATSNPIVSLLTMTADSSYVDIIIFIEGSELAITKRFSLTKTKAGQTGLTGPIYLPRGEWNDIDTYTKTAAVIMYVVYEGYCYEPNVASITGGNTPLYDVQHSGGNWISMGRFDVVAARVVMANFALLAGGVFWNNKLMSQYGKDTSGNASSNYSEYSEDASGVENGNFHPNILLDWITGFAKLAGGNIKANSDGSIDITGLLSTAASGRRIVLNPSTNSLKEYDSLNRVIVAVEFDTDAENSYSDGLVRIYTYIGEGTTQATKLHLSGGQIIMYKGTVEVLNISLHSSSGTDYVAPWINLNYLHTAAYVAGGKAAGGFVYRNGNNLCITTS